MSCNQISRTSDEGCMVDGRSLQSSLTFTARRTVRLRRRAPSRQHHLQGSSSRICHLSSHCRSVFQIRILRTRRTKNEGGGRREGVIYARVIKILTIDPYSRSMRTPFREASANISRYTVAISDYLLLSDLCLLA